MSVPSGATTYMIFRLQIDKELTSLGDIAATIEKTGGDIVGIDVISSGRTSTVRDITVNVLIKRIASLSASLSKV